MSLHEAFYKGIGLSSQKPRRKVKPSLWEVLRGEKLRSSSAPQSPTPQPAPQEQSAPTSSELPPSKWKGPGVRKKRFTKPRTVQGQLELPYP